MDERRRAETIVSLDAARLERAVRAACAVAFADARRARPAERFYAFGVWAGAGLDLAAVACTEEAMRGATAAARWRPEAWPRVESVASHFEAARAQLERHGARPDASPALRARTLDACARALHALDEDGHFGTGPERARIVVAVFTPDATPEELVAAARRLNPPAAVARLAREVGARPQELGADLRAYAVDALAVGPEHVAALADDDVLAWGWPDGAERLRVAVPGASALASADELLVVGEGRRGGVHLVHLDGTAPGARLDGPAAGVAALALTDDARTLFVASHGEELLRLDVARRAVRATRRARALSLSASPAGDLVAAATGVRLLVLDAATLGSRRCLGRRTDRFRAVAFTPDPRRLIAGGSATDGAEPAGVVALFDPASGREEARLAAGDEVTCVACSPDGRLVAAGDASGEARVWALDDLAEVARLRSSQQALTAVAFAPPGGPRDGALLTAGRDVERGPAVRCWSLPSSGSSTAGRRPPASRKLRA